MASSVAPDRTALRVAYQTGVFVDWLPHDRWERPTTSAEYLRLYGFAFPGDIAREIGSSEQEAALELDRLARELRYDRDFHVHPWPQSSPITALYVSARRDEHADQVLRRWASRVHGLLSGVPSSQGPVVLTASTYAAVVGDFGRALAGLLIARDTGLVKEVDLTPLDTLAIGPAYVLPRHASTFAQVAPKQESR